MEARQRKLSKGMNSYSREFFSMIFESIYSEQATHYYFKVNMTIPEVYIYMPTKSNNTKDMLRFKASNIIFTRSGDTGYSAIQDRYDDNILGDPKHTNNEYSYPSIFTIASVSLSISDAYNSMINDLEVQKQDIKQNIFRTEKIKMVLESKITEARTEPNRARKRDSSTSYKILSDKTFRSKEFRVQSHLPPIEAELDSRALTVIMQIYDLWVVNIPFLVHPYLEVSQFERVSQLMSDPIFQSFNFSAHLLNKIMSHTLVSYDLKIKQIAIRFKIGRSLTLLAEDLKLYSAYGFFFTKHKNAASNIVLYDESTSATIFKFDNRATNKEKRSEDYLIEVNFNNPYLLGAFKRYQNVMKEEVICWEYPIDITMNVFSRIFVIFDPTAVLYFQKESLVRYTQSKQDNLNEIRNQIQRGNRIRKLVETNFSGMPVYHNTYLEETIFTNKKDFLKAQEEQLIKMMFNFEGGTAVHLNFDGKPLYLVFTPYLSVKLHLDTNNLVHLYLKMIDPKVIDTSGYGLKDHPTIVEPHRESRKTSSIVKLVFTQLNPTLAKSKRFSSYLGIKAKNLKVIILKRRIQELIEYGRKYLLYLFVYDRDHALRGQAYFDSIPKHSTLFIEILLQDSIYIVPRSTVSSEGLILSCNKIALWNIGAWGASCSDLVKTGEFDPQFIVEKREFFDVLEDDQQEDLINLQEMLSGETATQRSNSSGSKSTGIHHKCQDAFRVFASKLKGMFSSRIYQSTYYTKQEIDTNSVLETGKYGTIQINFNATSMLDFKKPIIPIEGNCHLISHTKH